MEILYKSGTGHEESLGKTQMQCLLEQEKDLTAQVQRQARVLLESITQQRTAGALSSCGLMPLWGKLKASKKGRKKTHGDSKSPRRKSPVAGEEEACRDVTQSSAAVLGSAKQRSPFSWVNNHNWVWDAQRTSDKCWLPAIQINSRQPVGQWPLK